MSSASTRIMPRLRFHQQLHRLRARFRLRRSPSCPTSVSSRSTGDVCASTIFFARWIGFRDARLVERLQDVVDGVHFERLHRIVVERRGEDDLRQAELALHQLLDHAEPVEPGHLHIEKHQVRDRAP